MPPEPGPVLTAVLQGALPIIVPEAEHPVTGVQIVLRDTEVLVAVLSTQGVPDTEAPEVAQGVPDTGVREAARGVPGTAGVQEAVRAVPEVYEALAVLHDLQEVEDLQEAAAVVEAEGINHPNILKS